MEPQNPTHQQNLLEEHREALLAGVAALSASREMLGSELRDVFDTHPRSPLPQRLTLDMQLFTAGGRESKWPHGIEWLNDAYPIPYWVRRQQEADAAAAAAAGGGAAPSTASAPSKTP